MLTPESVAQWLNTDFDLPVRFLPGPQPSPVVTPEVVGLVMPAPGYGSDVEGLFDWVGFMLSVRGPQIRTYDEQAYVAAFTVDEALRFIDGPFYVDSTYVSSMYRPGAPPQLVAPTPDFAERTTYSAIYLFHASAIT